jgi:hypothetical protein
MKTRFTELFAKAFSVMRQADVDRHIASSRLKKSIVEQYRNARQPVPKDSMLDAEVDAKSGKEFPTRKATGDYVWARDEARTMAAYETAELLRLITEQNETTIRQNEVMIGQNTQLLELLKDRLPRKIY